MPKPVHVICSQSGAEDKVTGFVSLFQLVEQIKAQRIPEEAVGKILIQPLQLRITATWMRLGGDEDQEFDFEVSLILPPEEKRLEVAAGQFKFEKLFHRVTSRITGHPPLEASGIMRVESRVRRSGTENWISQDCPILLEIQDGPLPDGNGKAG